MATANAYPGTVKQGKFLPDDRAAFTKAFCRKDGTRMVVIAKKLVANRSSQTNRYWWSCVVALFMDEIGMVDKEECHHIILENIGHYDLKRIGNRDVKIVKDTHDLGQDEFALLIDHAGQLFAEWFGGFIPAPGSPQAAAMVGGS
ncbi:MAG: hypothetical protein M3Y08_01180 [Fibrobacterota bacterium]|nr:hypothetical protein [Fibrobacterota bacterium]